MPFEEINPDDLAPAKPKRFMEVEPPKDTALPRGVPTAEQEALVPEDPISIMGRHPYATAAATGPLLGPTLGLGETVGAIPGAGAVAGAAEQMAYQKIGDIGQKIAGPEHPYLGMIPGLVAPLGPRALLRVGGAKLATKAATAAEAQLQAEREARAIADDKLAMTGPQAAALARPIGQLKPEDAQKLSQAKQAMWTTRREALKQVGQQYDPIFEPIEAKPLEPEQVGSIAKSAKEAQETVLTRGRRLSTSTQKLLDELSSPPSAMTPDELKGQIAELLKGGKKIDPTVQAKFGRLLTEWSERNPGKSIQIETRDAIARQAFGEDTNQQTIGRLRGTMTRIMQEADRPGATATDRAALFHASKPIVEALDKAVPDEQKPLLASINAQYAQINKIFPHAAMRDLNKAATLPQLGHAVFEKMQNSNPAAVSMGISRMNPAQKGLMRNAFASWVLSDTEASPKELFNRLSKNSAAIRELDFPSELQNVGIWKDLVAGQRTMEAIPKLPAQGQFVAGFQDRLRREGWSKEALEAADDAMRKSGEKSMPYLMRSGARMATFGLLGGYGAFVRQPALVVPLAAYMGSHFLYQAITQSPELLPSYRRFLMAGWTRDGGDAFGRMMVATGANAVRQAAANKNLRPDKAIDPATEKLKTISSMAGATP